MATIWHDRLAVEPCKVVIWYDHFWISRSPVLFRFAEMRCTSDTFSGDVSRFPCLHVHLCAHFACTCSLCPSTVVWAQTA